MVGVRFALLAVGFLVVAGGGSAGAAEPPETKLSFTGFVLATFTAATAETNQADIPLWVGAAEDATFAASARQTRFGLRARRDLSFQDGRPCRWAEAQLEADFLGGAPNAGPAEPFALPRLRIATVALAADGWRLAAGQDWVLLAPVVPVTLSHQAIPGFAASGNLWARQAGLQGSWRFGATDGAHLTTQAALLTPITADAAADAPFVLGNAAGPGERAGAPAVEARVAAGFRTGGKPSVVGVSGHLGRQRHAIAGGDDLVTVWGAALDVDLKLGPVTLLGEAFAGRGLGAFLGGVAQGIRATGGDPPAEAHGVDAVGGWAQVVLALPAGLRAAVGAGFDDPDDDDLVAGDRARNRSAYATVLYTHAPLEAALELELLDTDRVGGPNPDPALAINLAALFRF